MRFGILGPLEATDDRDRQLALGGRKQRAVLAILLLHADQVVSSERLIEELWPGEPPASAAKGLHVHVSRLRSALGDGADRIVTAHGGYRIHVTPGELDRDRFERLLAEGASALETEQWELAGERLRTALALWRGRPFSDFDYDAFAQAEIARLSELQVVATERLIEAELALGHEVRIIGQLERLVREHPYRERLRGQLMLALYRAGRQADALAAYRTGRSVLVDELGIEPSADLRQLHEAILAQDATLSMPRIHPTGTGVARSVDGVGLRSGAGVERSSTNLPRWSRALVGREHERAILRELIVAGAGSIVTITGIGGVGKTRLAAAVGSDLLEHSPGGVFLVRLAGIHDPDSILPMVADAVGLSDQGDSSLEAALTRRLGEHRTILILDNFEQLLLGASVVADLAAGAEQLRILITSQVPLRIGPEHLFQLGPLTREGAAALFIERAHGRLGEFVPTEDDRTAIDEICARVDWMPLAIELAAARVGVLGPSELARRLEQPLGVLTRGARDAPERQRSLRAAIDWTHALLTGDQQSLFARLGVCAGPVRLEFVESLSVHGSAAGTLDALDELLACSFVRRQEHERLGTRFSVPQALRDYALERLRQNGDEPAVRRLHAERVQRLAHAARLWKWGATAQERLALLAATDEIRPAVAWTRTHDPELHVRICSALSSYWSYADVLSEVGEELRRAWASGAGSDVDRAWLTTLLAKIAQLAGDHTGARELMTAAVAAWDVVEDEYERALGLGPLSWVLRWDGRHEAAIASARESLEVLRRSGERRLVLRGLVFLAHTLADSGDFVATNEVLVEADQLSAGDPTWELAAIHGDCAELGGDDLAALALYAESLAWTSTTGESHQMLMDMRAIVTSLERLHHYESALETFELTRLEERRTGRFVTTASWDAWLGASVAVARANTSEAIAAAAAVRAADVDVARRAVRIIELAQGALA
jgi:predicted ATPase/DNA-binding SARP family transcriptional activator